MSNPWDAIVIGSGFGGVFTALPLVEAGARVLMIERGPWVARGLHNWEPEGTLEKTPYYCKDHGYQVLNGGPGPCVGTASCVGGASVFYGGVSFRLRTSDFDPNPAMAAAGACWPFGYEDLAPWYDRAEMLLNVAGETGADPTEPPRCRPYPMPPGPIGATSQKIADAGRSLGLKPFPLPLAISYDGPDRVCCLCPTCDTFACAISAKNDLATELIPDLVRKGLVLRCETVVTRLLAAGGRISGIEVVGRQEPGERETLHADAVVLAAGALATPHLLLASGLEGRSAAPDAVGRHLTRHCNGIVLGIFPRVPDRGQRFHKQIGFHDFYHGAPGGPAGTLGSIQQLQTPPIALVEDNSPRLLRRFMKHGLPHTTGLLVMAEDEPRLENGVWLDRGRRDAFGLPGLKVHQSYSERDLQGRRALYAQARRILRRAGAFLFYHHDITTFSHAAGTVRFGEDPRTAPLDPDCRFRGVDNLYVTDASFMPSGGGVNPSLTIAANALRVGTVLARNERKTSP